MHINAQTQPKTEESKKALSGLTPPGQRKVGLKLAELVTKFFLMKSQHSETTRYAHQGATAEFAKLLKNPNVTDITQSDITTYIEWLFTKKTNPRTVDNKIGALRSLINFSRNLPRNSKVLADREHLLNYSERVGAQKAPLIRSESA